jgi:hypothetical protein
MRHIPYGYRIENGRAVLDPDEARRVRAFFEDYIGGASQQEAARQNGIRRAQATLGNMLRDKKYMGDGFYPPIILQETFDRAQEERKRREKSLGRDKNFFARDKESISPFWGLVFCGKCGGAYRRYADGGKNRWACIGRAKRRDLHEGCPMIPEAALEKAFMEIIRSVDLSDLQDGPKKATPVIEIKYGDPFRQAEYAYSLVEIDDFAYLTKKLKKLLAEAPPVFDGEFMKSAVRRITVCGDRAEFELINGKTYGKELSLGAADGKERVGHTGAKKYAAGGGGQRRPQA